EPPAVEWELRREVFYMVRKRIPAGAISASSSSCWWAVHRRTMSARQTGAAADLELSEICIHMRGTLFCFAQLPKGTNKRSAPPSCGEADPVSMGAVGAGFAALRSSRPRRASGLEGGVRGVHHVRQIDLVEV